MRTCILCTNKHHARGYCVQCYAKSFRDRLNEKQRQYRRSVGNRVTHKYEKTKRGMLMRLYRNMLSRVSGVQWQKAHLYYGKDLLPKDVFYQWAVASPDFHKLYSAWRRSNYDRKKTPTVDRMDSSRGYDLGNMRWLTHSENSREGCNSRYAKLRQQHGPTR